jgi:hypothetical protein
MAPPCLLLPCLPPGPRYAYGKRHLNNADELIALVEAYNLTYT